MQYLSLTPKLEYSIKWEPQDWVFEKSFVLIGSFLFLWKFVADLSLHEANFLKRNYSDFSVYKIKK